MQHFFATSPRGLEPLLAGELAQLRRETRRRGFRRRFLRRRLAQLLCGQPLVEARFARALARRRVRLRGRGRFVRGRAQGGLAEPVRRRAHASCQLVGAEEPAEEPGFRHAAHQGRGLRPLPRRARQPARASTAADPDVRVHAFLEAARGALYLDTSGEPLFKRGWRADAGEAPLRENLAAGIVMLVGLEARRAAARSDVRRRHAAGRGGGDGARPRSRARSGALVSRS